MNSARRKAYTALLINTLIWGAALPLVKLALLYTTPLRWLFYRYFLACSFSIPLLIYLVYKFKPKLKQILTIICMESVGVVALLAILYEGLAKTSALDASIIAATTPIFTVLGGIIFLKETEEKKEWLGLVLAFAGTILITIEPLFNGPTQTSGSLYGNGLIILHNVIWAGYLIMAKKVYKNIPKILVTSISFWVGLVGFAFLTKITSEASLLVDFFHPTVFWVAFYMAIPGSIVAATLYLYGQNLIEVSEATLFSYLQPLVAIPLSMWLLSEKLKFTSFLGLCIIILGVYLAETRRR